MAVTRAPRELRLASLKPKGRVHPSPDSWRDQVLYFLLPDRFSDGLEAKRSLFDRYDPDRFGAEDKSEWMEAGKRFQGGTLKGIESKLGYLRDMGATALWIGPVWKQRRELETYHGYGIQDFMDVDPRFGTPQDLRDLVDGAHSKGIYVILDVIYNHTGNNWFYEMEGRPESSVDYRFSPAYPFHGWRSASGDSVITIRERDDGVWPREFQDPNWYTRAGSIKRWDPYDWEEALHPDNEFRRGDFYDLKDLDLNRGEVLSAVVRMYQHWIAVTDCDGFRIDTVKHVPWEASRNFCGAIREYAEAIGKENFLLLGEVTGGGGMARNYLDIFGRNIDAVLDIGEPSVHLARMVKGHEGPGEFFSQFGGHDDLGSHRETGRYHVSVLDDHDMVGREKRRFSAGNDIPERYAQAAHAVGVMLTTLGIPCVYYGTEQAFDGSEEDHDPEVEPPGDFGVPHADRYVREAMFGGTFGAFGTERCHFFDTRHPTYMRIGAIARVRNRRDHVGLALRRGRQYLRESSLDGALFTYSGMGEIVAWSRILHNQEVLVALNTNGLEAKAAHVTVDSHLHKTDDGGKEAERKARKMTYLYRGDWSDDQLRKAPRNQVADVVFGDERATVWIELPPAGMVILA